MFCLFLALMSGMALRKGWDWFVEGAYDWAAVAFLLSVLNFMMVYMDFRTSLRLARRKSRFNVTG